MNAPAAVANRVLAAIAHAGRFRGIAVPGRRGPVALRMASLVVMLALFGGLCLAGEELLRTDAITQAMQRAGQLVFPASAPLETCWARWRIRRCSWVTKLGTAFIVTCLVAAGLGYATFLVGNSLFPAGLRKTQTLSIYEITRQIISVLLFSVCTCTYRQPRHRTQTLRPPMPEPPGRRRSFPIRRRPPRPTKPRRNQIALLGVSVQGSDKTCQLCCSDKMPN